MMYRFRITAVCATISAVTIAGGGVIAHAGPATGTRYVALGSSYAAGAGITPIDDEGCQRSARNYPQQLSETLGLQLTDATCSGATTTDIVDRPQRLTSGHTRPPQIDAVTSDTRLVTITIGGNDLGLAATMIAQSCGPAAAVHVPAAFPVVTEVCSAVIGTSPAPGPRDFEAVEQKMAEVVRAVHRRAPNAQVVLVEYLPAIDPQATLCPNLPLAPADAHTARRTYDGLVTATRAAARATGATSVGIPQADQHAICSAAPWIHGFGNPLATGSGASTGSSYHPNLDGMAAVAGRLAAELGT